MLEFLLEGYFEKEGEMKNNEKYIKKGRMCEAYHNLDPCIQNKVLLNLEDLLSENKHPNPEIAQSILPCIAIYQTLLQNGYTKVESFKIVKMSVMNSYKGIANFAYAMGKFPFFFPLFRMMCRMSMKDGVNEKGWTFKWRQNDKQTMVWECHDCIYVNTFVKYGVRELAPIFCECEDTIYGNLKYAQWGRTKTIGRGAQFCNFSFYNNKNEVEFPD